QEANFAPAHFNLGYCYFFQKQYYNAREEFDRAVQYQPNMPLIYLYLGRSLEKLNKNEEAIREYTNANRINPNLYLPYLYLSFVHFKLNQRKSAFSFLEKMIKRDPDYDQNSYRDFRYVQEKVSYDFMIKAYSFLLKEKKFSPTVVAGLGLLHYLDGNRGEAKSLVQKAIDSNPQDATAYTIYGYMLQKEGNLELALAQLQKSLRYQYENSLTHVLIADLDMQLGRFQEAVEHCRKIFSFDPFYVRAYTTLGVALVNLERTPEALEAFNKALEYDPNYIPAKKMLLQYSK
ncbi:MAG: tetratricopeptide repeat protein, partial [Deltaproteobacteria bacterium]|nr:tetratricopeptide repeat protein [Deltaproteobacteria bacterium]